MESSSGANDVECPIAVVHYHCVYGGPFDSASGGTKLQNELFTSLETFPHVSLSRYVISNDEEAMDFVVTVEARPHIFGKSSEIFLVDGLGAVWLSPGLMDRLKAARPSSTLCGLVHFPFSTPFYEQEPWLLGLKPTADAALLRAGDPSCNDESWLRDYERLVLQAYDQLIAVGPITGAVLENEFGIPGERVIVIDAPLSPLVLGTTSSVVTPTVPVETSTGITAIKLVTVGTICARKRQLTLIRAAGRLIRQERFGRDADRPNDVDAGQERATLPPAAFHLSIVGSVASEPCYVESCRAILADISTSVAREDNCRRSGGAAEIANFDVVSCGDWSLSVDLCGPLPHTDALSHVAGADVFLFASNFESFGLAPLEAAALGTPIISSSCGVLHDHLPPSSTIFVESCRELARDGTEGIDNGTAEGLNEDLMVEAWCTALRRFLKDSSTFKKAALQNAPAFQDRHRGISAEMAARLHQNFTHNNYIQGAVLSSTGMGRSEENRHGHRQAAGRKKATLNESIF